MNLFAIFLTGLTVGGLTCLAVQGGLLASVITARESEATSDTKRHALFATAAFLVAKLVSHILLGFVLGAAGGAIALNDTVQAVMQLVAGLYMLAVAFNLLTIHPIFRYAVIQPPRFLTRLVKNQAKSRDLFAPALLGAMTIFIPCGTTVAMEALAISSANAFTGAAIMGTFILGTIPLFFGIGLLTSVMGDRLKTRFLRLAAVVIIYLGLAAINGSLIALNSPVSTQALANWLSSPAPTSTSAPQPVQSGPSQEIEIFITASGYSPEYLRVKRGVPVVLKLTSQDAYSCASAFRIPSLKISRNMRSDGTQIVNFTPEKTGKIVFTCSMGMYRGIIEVYE